MKSGLGDRNNLYEISVVPIPANSVSMKSGLGDRNNSRRQ